MSSPALGPQAPARNAEGGRSIRVGMLGYGTVGSGVYRMLEANREAITRKIGLPVEIVKIGIRNTDKSRNASSDLFTTDLASIIDDPEIDVILELMGGTQPAGEMIERALRHGKHVVTANKEFMAKHGWPLITEAARLGLDLHFEAAVGGGIPLIQPMKHQLAGNDVIKLMGILNGTTNYILTRMSQDGTSLEEALAEAQAGGYAEADPSSDVDSFDPQYKLAILASIAFGGEVKPEWVYREGIRGVTQLDIHYADVLGYTIKLLGIAEPTEDGKVLARIHPTLIPKDHPLAAVNDVYNAVWLRGDFVGDLMFSGRGAGADPTASAVIGDLIDVGRNIKIGGSGSAIPIEGHVEPVPIEELVTEYYVRLIVLDKPMVLGAIATAFGNHNVSLAAMEMRTLDEGRGEIVFLTHHCREGSFREAIEDVGRQDVVHSVESWMRVES